MRVGTFQYFAAREDFDAVRTLADYVIARHYPEIKSAANPYLELLAAVMRRQASLVARWMQVGFIHGVMNTDNFSVSGETIDYGPCAFLDVYDANQVFSSIDSRGRYAYSNQPSIAQWNLVRFAETLLPLIDAKEERAVELATESINAFAARIDLEWLEGMRAKLGLTGEDPRDREIAQSLLRIMQRTEADFTLTFRDLCAFADSSGPRSLGALGEDGELPLPLFHSEREPPVPPPCAPSTRASLRAIIVSRS